MKILSFLILGFIVPCLAAEKSQLITQLEAGNKQVVVTYGTSLTEGGAWVKQIQAAIDQRFPGLCTIHNKGGSGKNSDWGVSNLEDRVLKLRPDTVFLEFSMNDSADRFKMSVETAKANLETMLNAILKMNPQCEIILMTMTPGDAYPKGHKSYRNNIEGHYEMYRAVAKERGLRLIDHYPNWKALESKDEALFKKMVPDNIHVTAEGCEKIITPVILDAIGIEQPKAKKP
jgi:acyl-CoA thioesterase-1